MKAIIVIIKLGKIKLKNNSEEIVIDVIDRKLLRCSWISFLVFNITKVFYYVFILNFSWVFEFVFKKLNI